MALTGFGTAHLLPILSPFGERIPPFLSKYEVPPLPRTISPLFSEPSNLDAMARYLPIPSHPAKGNLPIEQEIKMKYQLMMLSAACGLTLLGGTNAPAQSQSYKLASDVPFAFHVDEKTCPSGQYTVERQTSHDYQSIRGAKGSCSLFLGYGMPLSGNSAPKLVFHRYH